MNETGINFNGKLRYNLPEGVDKEQYERMLVSKIHEYIDKGLEEDEFADAQIINGSCWTEEGQVKVGRLAFEVSHCTKREVSGASVNIKPRPGSYGEGHINCRISAYVSQHSAFLVARDLNGKEKLLSEASLSGGKLVVRTMRVDEQNADGAIPALSVPFEGFVRLLQ